MPYSECDYSYDSIDGVKNRIDNPHLVPATPSLMSGLMAAMSGEPSNIQQIKVVLRYKVKENIIEGMNVPFSKMRFMNEKVENRLVMEDAYGN